MKLATYNLRHGGRPHPHSPLALVLAELGADILCLQESYPPHRYFEDGDLSALASHTHSHVADRKWGSAILSTRCRLKKVPLASHTGWVEAARFAACEIAGAPRKLTVVSLHAPIEKTYIAAVNAVFDTLAAVVNDGPLIVAGDFNVTTAMRHGSENGMVTLPGEQRLLTRLRREFGLVNAWQLLHPNENLPQTLRWTGNAEKPYHCDGIFISHHLIPHLESATVVTGSRWAEMSDHYPMVASFA